MKKHSVKERLINTATDLFYTQGYNRTGINEILEKSGVAKASMYQHFRSKEEIGLEFLKKLNQEHGVALSERLQNTPKGKARILELFAFVQDFFEQENYRGCWCLNTLSEIPKDNELMNREITRQKVAFRKLVRELVKENTNHSESDTLGDRIYLLYEVALSESLLFREDWPIKEARATAEILLT